VGSVEVVEVLSLLELVVEQLGVIDHDTLEHAIELFLIDAMRSLNLAIESRCCRSDVDVSDATIQDVIVEL
jgi:hypothetical protein